MDVLPLEKLRSLRQKRIPLRTSRTSIVTPFFEDEIKKHKTLVASLSKVRA